jgi:hypothetical protein
MYQKIESSYGNIIVLDQNGVLLSFSENPDNTDYRAYLAWVAEGNEPVIVESEGA